MDCINGDCGRLEARTMRFDGKMLPPFVLALMLALFTFLFYFPALRFEFVDYDDGTYVYLNQNVLGGLNFHSISYAFSTFDGGSWMPLTWLTHQLDTSLFGPGPAGRHATSIVLHAVNAGLLLLTLFKLTGKLWPSCLASVLFAVHPLRTESVAWVSERKDVLCGLFFLLGLLAYTRYARKPEFGRYLLVLLCLLCGLMAKPMLVTFPLLLLLLDYWPLCRNGAIIGGKKTTPEALLMEKVPMLVLAGAVAGLTYWSQRDSGALSHWGSTWIERASNVAGNYLFYLEKFIFPANLTVLYPDHSFSIGLLIFLPLVLLGLTAMFILARQSQPWLLVGWGWFLLCLLPVIGIVPVGMTQVADRYLYLPSIGLGVAVAWWLWAIQQHHNYAGRLALLASLVWLALLARETRTDLARWRNSEQLFTAALRVAPHKVAYDNLAYYAIKAGNFDLALDFSTKAVELDPTFGPSHSTRAMAYAGQGDYTNARLAYDQAVALGDRPIRSASELTPHIGREFDAELGWEQFMAISGLEPKTSGAFKLRATSRLKAGNTVAAIADLTEAITLRPDDLQLFTARGNAFATLADWPHALADLSLVIESSPTNAAAYQNRAVIFYKMGEYGKAWADIEQQKRLGGEPHASFIQALSSASGSNLRMH